MFWVFFRSEQVNGLRDRTMLRDGDSTAFNAVHQNQPYGPDRLVTKLECVNHCHKRMGTALRKKSKEERLGGRGHGRLTQDKCTRLQNYYCGAILSHLNNRDAMRDAIWASLLHCCSTDEQPHHRRCPQGINSWCFYNKALAEGRRPSPHEDHCGTAISPQVLQSIIPIYQRMSSPELLKKITHGKTQNANESVNSQIWLHCPKEVFVGADWLSAAVAEAVAKFNRGNFHLAQVLDFMNIPVNTITLSFIEKMDRERVKKAEKATGAAAVQQRRAQHDDDSLKLHVERTQRGTHMVQDF